MKTDTEKPNDVAEATDGGLLKSTALSGIVVAVDFDGTCVTHEFPKVGREIGAARVLKRMTDAGAKLILWTMRSDGRAAENPNPLTDAVQWFEKHEIPLYGTQRNPTQDEWTTSPKAYAKIYIDDAAFGCPLKAGLPGERPHVDWDVVEAILFPNAQAESGSRAPICSASDCLNWLQREAGKSRRSSHPNALHDLHITECAIGEVERFLEQNAKAQAPATGASADTNINHQTT